MALAGGSNSILPLPPLSSAGTPSSYLRRGLLWLVCFVHDKGGPSFQTRLLSDLSNFFSPLGLLTVLPAHHRTPHFFPVPNVIIEPADPPPFHFQKVQDASRYPLPPETHPVPPPLFAGCCVSMVAEKRTVDCQHSFLFNTRERGVPFSYISLVFPVGFPPYRHLSSEDNRLLPGFPSF